jgi:autoinducer 2-degrading protein
MIATLVHVWVKPEYVNDFIKASVLNHKNSIKENGNVRFDVLQDAHDPTKFVLYEAYDTEAAAAAHKETGHYKLWRDTVANWMAQPRRGEKHIILAPESTEL